MHLGDLSTFQKLSVDSGGSIHTHVGVGVGRKVSSFFPARCYLELDQYLKEKKLNNSITNFQNQINTLWILGIIPSY